MDGRGLIEKLDREIALAGPKGLIAKDLWNIMDTYTSQPLGDDIKDALADYLLKHRSVTFESGVYSASEENQWIQLTGSPSQGNSVGQKAFEVLCAVSRAREQGISTIDVAKQTGQDLRSLFGRVKTLLSANLIIKYPIISGGTHTNMLVYHPYIKAAASHSETVNKNSISEEILNYVHSGHSNIRSVVKVVSEMSKTLTSTEPKRRRPTVRRILKELEILGCIRRIRIFSNSNYLVPCIEYVSPFRVPSLSEKNNIGMEFKFFDDLSEKGDDNPEDVEGVEPVVEEDEEDDEEADLDIEKELSTGNYVVKTEPEDPSEVAKANNILPLAHQIHDAIRQTGTSGISVMELSDKLTGKFYRRPLGRYLMALTTRNKNQPENVSNYTRHLTIVKGTDFAKRVKYYRYFSEAAYDKKNVYDEGWGNFPEQQPPKGSSLKQIQNESVDLQGACSLVRSKTGEIVPVFRGEKVSGEVVLKAHSGATKKLGRPRKNQPPTNPEPVEDNPKPIGRCVPLEDRVWEGGVSVGCQKFPPSKWVMQRFEKISVIEEETPSTSPTSVSVGSLAHVQRVDTLLKVISFFGGVVQGGSVLMDLFNECAQGEHKADRKTIQKVCQKLIEADKLKQITFNVKSSSGSDKLKTLLYDPSKFSDPDDPVILDVKKKIMATEVQRRSVATKQGMQNLQSIPVKQISQKDFETIHQPMRIKTTKSKRLEKKKTQRKTRFGPSAADVLGIDAVTGEDKSFAKRKRTNTKTSQPVNINAAHMVSDDLMDSLDTDMDVEVDPLLTEASFTDNSDKSPLITSDNGADSQAQVKPDLNEEIDLDWLGRAVIVSRSFFNTKLSSPIDWKIVAGSLPTSTTVKEAKKHWNEAKKFLIKSPEDSKSADIVFKRVQDFEDLFMECVKKDQVSYPENLTDPISVTRKYVEWWIAKENEPETNANLSESLSDSLSSLKLCPINHDDKVVDPFLHLQNQASFVNAEKLLEKTSFGASFTQKYDSYSSPSRLILSESEMRVRAMIAADDENFDPKLGIAELEGLSNEETEEAISNLVAKKVIKWGAKDNEKVPPGRPYVLSDYIHHVLTPKLDQCLPTELTKALTEILANSHKTCNIPETITDKEVLCLIELATHGIGEAKANVLRDGEKVGLLASSYKSRGIDKQEFECDLNYSIIQGSDKKPTRKVTPPISSNPKRPWIWQTKFLFSQSIWQLIVSRIVTTVLFRPGISPEVIQNELKTVLLSEEAHEAINSLLEGGALTKSKFGALMATPDWFTHII